MLLALEDCRVTFRTYTGQGKLRFNSGEEIYCDFILEFGYNGEHSMLCSLYLSNEYAFILNKALGESLVYASFSGTMNQRGKITINNMVVDKVNVNGYERVRGFYDKKFMISPNVPR